jgi:hypothetical protein
MHFPVFLSNYDTSVTLESDAHVAAPTLFPVYCHYLGYTLHPLLKNMFRQKPLSEVRNKAKSLYFFCNVLQIHCCYPHFILLYRSVNDKARISIPYRYSKLVTNCFTTDAHSLKQGDVLSSLLLNFASECAIRKVQENQIGLEFNETYQLLVYANDVILLGDSIKAQKRTQKPS